jgi:hypothetical protein
MLALRTLSVLALASGKVYEAGQYEAQHGQGKMTCANGEAYEGQYEAGKKHGQGKFTFASGGVYEGQWEADKKYGQGKYHTRSPLLYHNFDLHYSARFISSLVVNSWV